MSGFGYRFKKHGWRAAMPLFLIVGAPLYAENAGDWALGWQVAWGALIIFIGAIVWTFLYKRLMSWRKTFDPTVSDDDLMKISGFVASLTPPGVTKNPAPTLGQLESIMKGELVNGVYCPVALATLGILADLQRAGHSSSLSKVYFIPTVGGDSDDIQNIVKETVYLKLPATTEVKFGPPLSSGDVKDPKRLLDAYNRATKWVGAEPNLSFVGIDATAGTVMHSLAAATTAEDLDARLIYNVTRQNVGDPSKTNPAEIICVDV